MTNTKRVSLLGIVSIFIIFFSLSPYLPVEAGTGNDYFTTPRNSELLYNVEKYHLSDENFFARYKSRRYYYALQDLEFVLNYFPNHPKALMFMGSVAQLTKDSSLGVIYYEKAIRLYPQYALTHAQYGEYLVNIGLVKEGIERLKKAIEIDPKLAIAYKWLSKAYTKIGDLEMARRAAERAKELGINIKEGRKQETTED